MYFNAQIWTLMIPFERSLCLARTWVWPAIKHIMSSPVWLWWSWSSWSTWGKPSPQHSLRQASQHAHTQPMQRGYVVYNYESNISHLRSRKIRSKALLQIDMYLQWWLRCLRSFSPSVPPWWGRGIGRECCVGSLPWEDHPLSPCWATEHRSWCQSCWGLSQLPSMPTGTSIIKWRNYFHTYNYIFLVTIQFCTFWYKCLLNVNLDT